jgi:hypothetical protein
MKPAIRKLGTIDCDLVETTPIVFRGRLYRFEYVRTGYAGNQTGESYFRFVDHATGDVSAPFARGYHLGSVFVERDVLYVTGTNIWDGERVELFVSADMQAWETRNALSLPGYGIFNTSMCRAEDRYVLMFEVGRPSEVAGVPFTARFAVSTDLQSWELTPPELSGWALLQLLPGGTSRAVVRSAGRAVVQPGHVGAEPPQPRAGGVR